MLSLDSIPSYGSEPENTDRATVLKMTVGSASSISLLMEKYDLPIYKLGYVIH